MTANFMLALMIGLLATVVILVVLGVIDSPRTPPPSTGTQTNRTSAPHCQGERSGNVAI